MHNRTVSEDQFHILSVIFHIDYLILNQVFFHKQVPFDHGIQSFHALLKLTGWHFGEDIFVFTFISLQFPILVVSLSGFGSRVILAS